MKDTVNNGIRTEWETIRLTACCEREPVPRYGGGDGCPGCDRWDVEVIRRVRVADRHVEDGMIERAD